MADGKIKISELDEALQLSDNAEFPYSQDNGGVPTTFKAPANQIARKVAEGSTFTNLTTTAKTLVGAINELKALGSPILLGTTSPTAQQGADGNIYVQYTEGTSGADDEVDGIYVKIDGAWCEIQTGGGGGAGGHTIVDDSGTSLTQRTNLQFKGAYSEDNSTDDTTEIDVVREMTKAEFDELTEAEKTGFINITDITGGNDDRFQPVIYSEEEREIGVWTDGKPLYQKTIDLGALPNTGPNTVAHNINSLGIVVYASGTAYNSTSQVSLPIPYVSGGSSTYNIDINANSTNVTVTTYTDRSAFVGYIKLQYTKTTDTAGSGQWTPQGVPAHHYSEDEQIVGTWIDGSTIYEKSYYSDNIGYSTANFYKPLITIPDVNKVIAMEGIVANSARTNARNLGAMSGNNNDNYSWLFFDRTTAGGTANTMYFVSQDTWATGELFATIRYTKSST